MSGGLSWSLRWRLSVLWILEWGITGAILTYLPLYFREHGLQGQIGELMAVGAAAGLWVAPFVVGQVCDRWMATEKYLAIAHFVGGLSLMLIPVFTEMYVENDRYYGALLVCVAVYSMAYFPTVPLASSLTFRHLSDPGKQFGGVRIWGTVGWMLAGLGLSCWLGRTALYEWLVDTFPARGEFLAGLRTSFHWLPEPAKSDCFRIGAVLSFALSSFCVFLPATPPVREKRSGVAPLQTFALFKDRTFSMLIGVSFLLATVVPLYSLAVPQLLAQLDFEDDWVPALMTIGQVSEFPALLLLPLCLRRVGLKMTFAIGMGAWFVRYAAFAMEDPTWLILTAIGLHGICHVFLIIVIQLYIDSVCQKDVRASAQNLFTFVTMGLAMPAGFLLGGGLANTFTNGGEVDFRIFFAVPATIVLTLLLVFLKWFHLDGKAHSGADDDPELTPGTPAREGLL